MIKSIVLYLPLATDSLLAEAAGRSAAELVVCLEQVACFSYLCHHFAKALSGFTGFTGHSETVLWPLCLKAQQTPYCCAKGHITPLWEANIPSTLGYSNGCSVLTALYHHNVGETKHARIQKYSTETPEQPRLAIREGVWGWGSGFLTLSLGGHQGFLALVICK